MKSKRMGRGEEAKEESMRREEGNNLIIDDNVKQQ